MRSHVGHVYIIMPSSCPIGEIDAVTAMVVPHTKHFRASLCCFSILGPSRVHDGFVTVQDRNRSRYEGLNERIVGGAERAIASGVILPERRISLRGRARRTQSPATLAWDGALPCCKDEPPNERPHFRNTIHAATLTMAAAAPMMIA